MNERERWIVYPLLFFALGSALRDKFLQHVSTKELECQQLVAQQIICEDVSVRDPTKQNRIVAKLTSGTPDSTSPGEDADRFGVLLLFDSEGKELCGVTNQALSVREINCLAMKVVDPDNPARALAALASAAAPPAEQGGRPRRFGILALNNQEFGQLMGNPPPNPRGELPADGDDPPEDRPGSDSDSSTESAARGRSVGPIAGMRSEIAPQ
jgi:hypothetical protein